MKKYNNLKVMLSLLLTGLIACSLVIPTILTSCGTKANKDTTQQNKKVDLFFDNKEFHGWNNCFVFSSFGNSKIKEFTKEQIGELFGESVNSNNVLNTWIDIPHNRKNNLYKILEKTEKKFKLSNSKIDKDDREIPKENFNLSNVINNIGTKISLYVDESQSSINGLYIKIALRDGYSWSNNQVQIKENDKYFEEWIKESGPEDYGEGKPSVYSLDISV